MSLTSWVWHSSRTARVLAVARIMSAAYKSFSVERTNSATQIETIFINTNNTSIAVTYTTVTFNRNVTVNSHTSRSTLLVRRLSNGLDIRIRTEDYDTDFGELIDEIVEELSGLINFSTTARLI